MAALDNGEEVDGTWYGLTQSEFTVTVMGYSQRMTYTYQNGELVISYTDDGDIEKEKYTLCE